MFCYFIVIWWYYYGIMSLSMLCFPCYNYDPCFHGIRLLRMSRSLSKLVDRCLYTLTSTHQLSLNVSYPFGFFHKQTKLEIMALLTTLYICSFLPYLQHMMLVNMELDISGCVDQWIKFLSLQISLVVPDS